MPMILPSFRRATAEEIATAHAWVDHACADWADRDDEGRDHRLDEYEHALAIVIFANGGRASGDDQ
jgi:hypothetical protein